MENQLAHDLDNIRTDDVILRDAAPFSNWLLKNAVKKGLQDAGFKMPTTIQASAIPIGKTGLDLLIQSKAGTGKTLIFCTILLENCLDAPGLSSIIVAPTREIALQIENVLRRIARPSKKFEIVSAIGGTDMTIVRKQLQTANAVVGTPGRLVHLIESDMLKATDVKLVILDEADQLYSESHRSNLKKILMAVPIERQILACSATFCNDLDKELAKIMRNPLLISTKDKIAILIGIKQFIYKLPEQKGTLLEMEAKVEALLNIFKRIPFKLCMVFACSQSRAETYASYLKKANWQCDLISGALPQAKRNEIFQKFRNFETRILVSTDLMARGIDSENVNLVINLEPPRDMVNYLHRIGRAGRFGSFGIAINVLCTEKDKLQFKQIISEIGSDFKIHDFPEKADIEGEVINFWEPSTFKEEISATIQAETTTTFEAEEKHVEIAGILRSQNYENNNNNIVGAKLTEIKPDPNNIKILCSTEDSQISINTNTFCVDSKDSAVNVLNSPLPENKENILLCQPEDTPTSNRSSVQLSANTIDDASSIAVDSQFSSVQQELLAPCPSLVQDLNTKCAVNELKPTDDSSQNVRNQPYTDFFLDYCTNMEENSAENSQNESNMNSSAIIKNYLQPENFESIENGNKVTVEFIQSVENEPNEETPSDVPESNETTTIGEDFTNEKQDTSMQVCANSITPTEIEIFEKIETEHENSVSDEQHLTDSHTFLDQTIGVDNSEENENEEHENDENQQKIKEIWINEYYKQVNFIQSYTKFILDYSKNYNKTE